LVVMVDQRATTPPCDKLTRYFWTDDFYSHRMHPP
jgi:hypothetical protein